jgi:hypothetical protein
MATEFKINEFEFGDAAGGGFWLVEHYRNHLQYNDVLAKRTPPVLLPVFPIMSVEGGKIGRRSWLDSHQSWHELLRPLAGATGVDLSVVDMDNENEFTQWMGAHNAEHAFLDQAFGIA